jgi:hypothetical protein
MPTRRPRHFDTTVAQISRSKDGGPISHFGVVVIAPSVRWHALDLVNATGRVVDRCVDGLRVCELKEFADGRTVKVENVLTNPEEVRQALHRLGTEYQNGHAYDLLKNNCEHFARWVTQRERRSRQIDIALGVVATLVVCVLIYQLAKQGGLSSQASFSLS